MERVIFELRYVRIYEWNKIELFQEAARVLNFSKILRFHLLLSVEYGSNEIRNEVSLVKGTEGIFKL